MSEQATDEMHIRKGTTTLGIVCSDGLVLAADKRVTLGGRFISHKKFEKAFKVAENMAVTMAGTVSDAQLIIKLLRAELRLKQIRTGRLPSVKETANLLGAVVYHNIRKFSTIPGITGFLLGGYDEDHGFQMYEIGVDGSLVLYDSYVADGSGFMMALGVLDTLYKKDIKVQDAVGLAVKSINAAMQRDTATGDGIDVLTITKEGVKKVMTQHVEMKLTI